MGAPVILASLSAASQLAQMQAQAKSAADAANATVNDTYNQAGAMGVMNAQKATQQAQQASENQSKIVQDMLAEKASLNALSASSGIGGNLLDAMNREITMAGNTAIANVGEQNNRQQANTFNEQQSINSQALSAQNQAINQAKSARINLAKVAALGLNTASSYMTSKMAQQSEVDKLLAAAKKGGQ